MELEDNAQELQPPSCCETEKANRIEFHQSESVLVRISVVFPSKHRDGIPQSSSAVMDLFPQQASPDFV